MPNDRSLLKHPNALWWLSLVYSSFMWSFGTLMAGLTLYLINIFHVSQGMSYAIFAAFSALFWTLPLIGGYLSSQFGLRQSSAIGLFFCVIGSGMMLIPGSMDTMLFGLAAFLVGNAFFTPSLWCLVDYMYKKTDKRRESGFTLFYLYFNVGAVFGIFAGGFIQAHYGYGLEFIINTFFLLMAFVVFVWKVPHFEFDASRSLRPALMWNQKFLLLGLFVICVVATPLVSLLLEHVNLNNILLDLLSAFAALSILWMAYRQKTVVAKVRLIGFLILCFFSIAFWALYALEPSLVSVYLDSNVNKSILNLFTLPSTSWFAFEGAFVVLIGLLLSRVWSRLASRGIDISLPVKFGIALVLIGGGYLYLYLAIGVNGYSQIMPGVVLIFAYAFFAAGELFIGPLGISMVGKLSPHGSEGYLMGVWQLFMGFASIVGGFLAQYATVPAHASFAESNPIFAHMFLMVSLTAILIGIVLFAAKPWLKGLM